MGFGLVSGIVFPASALLNAKVSPLKLGQSAVLGKVSCVVLGQNHMSVLELSVLVLLRVFDLLEIEQIPTMEFNIRLEENPQCFIAPYLRAHIDYVDGLLSQRNKYLQQE